MVLQADILEEVILEVEASLEASKTLPNRCLICVIFVICKHIFCWAPNIYLEDQLCKEILIGI